MLEIAWFILVVRSRTHVPELQGCDVLPQSALQGSGAPVHTSSRVSIAWPAAAKGHELLPYHFFLLQL